MGIFFEMGVVGECYQAAGALQLIMDFNFVTPHRHWATLFILIFCFNVYDHVYSLVIFVQGRVDDFFHFLIVQVHFVFLLIEFQCNFSIPCKILPYCVYYY